MMAEPLLIIWTYYKVLKGGNAQRVRLMTKVVRIRF